MHYKSLYKIKKFRYIYNSLPDGTILKAAVISRKIYKLGDIYLEDVTAKKIKEYLYRAIRGEMKEECEECPNVCVAPEFIGKMLSQAKGINCHMLFMHPDAKNKLIVQVMLFLNPIFSFSVCISENASQYKMAKELPVEIVDIKYERK